MNIASLTAQLKLNIADFNRPLSGARKQMANFSSFMAKKSARAAKATAQMNGAWIDLDKYLTKGTRAYNRAKQAQDSLVYSGRYVADDLVSNYTSLNERLHKVGLGFKDVARIVAGITISQTFYRIKNAISDATSALWEFNKNLDYAYVTYSNLMGSAGVAQDFLDVLKQYSVDTIFEFSDLEQMSKKLLAYGIEYKNLMYIIEGLTNIGTVSGDTAALDRLALAIGQINAKGTLKAEEIRQLTNAYAPMYDILRDRFNLSEEDFANIGNLRLPAEEVINAIVDYANDKFGETAEAAMYTITGLNNRIVDSLKVMGAGMLKPFTTFYKSLAYYIANWLNDLQEAYATKGAGGAFEKLVPYKEWQIRIRELVATIKNMVSTIIAYLMTIWPYISQIVGAFLDGLNLLVTVLNLVSSAFIGLLRALSKNTVAMQAFTTAVKIGVAAWILFKMHLLATGALKVAKVAVVGLAKAILALSAAILKNPIIAGILLISAAVIGLSKTSKDADSAFSKLLRTLSSYSIGGSSSDNVLQVQDNIDGISDSAEKGSDKANQFWNAMEEGADKTSDAVDGAGKAAKKAADGLLSFDEVFKLNEPTSAGGAGTLDTSAFEDLGAVLGGLGGALIPDIPDLSEYAKNFVSALYTDLWDALKTIASGGATGAVVGGLAGFAIGGLVTRTMAGALAGAKLGAKIGTVAGAVFAGFWTNAYKELEVSLLKIGAGSAIGALVGGLAGMVIGAFATKTLDGALLGAKWGTGIGALIGSGVGAFWALATREMDSAIEGIVAGGGAGALAGGLAGLIIGAFSTKTLAGALSGAKLGSAIGGLLGAGIGAFWSQAGTAMKEQITAIVAGSATTMLLGGLAGMILGAFATRTVAGALTGAKYGAVIGAMINTGIAPIFASAEASVTEHISGLFAGIKAASNGAVIGAFAGMILGAVVGAFAGGIGALPGAKIGATLGAVLGSLGSMLLEYLNSAGITAALEDFFNGIGSSVAAFFGGLFGSITTWSVDTARELLAWKNTTVETFNTWKADIVNRFNDWYTATKAGVAVWAAETVATVNAWGYDTLNAVAKWLAETLVKMYTWFASTKENVKTWWTKLWDYRTWTAGWSAIKGWFSNLLTDIEGWFSTLANSISKWWDNLWKGKKASVDVSAKSFGSSQAISAPKVNGVLNIGHATGGIFNREHIARFAEGNKAEAVIPLENAGAMQPFVDAVSNGIVQSLMPIISTISNTTQDVQAEQLRPLYVGTLIADERGLRELNRKMRVIQLQEQGRRG